MRSVIRTGVLLGAAMLCAAVGAQGAGAPKPVVGPLCEACLRVCERPLSYEDSVLDDATDSYLLPAARAVSRAAAIEMADALRGIFQENKAGHFGRAYVTNAAAIESLAAKPAEAHASSAEIRALKAVRAALYADTITGLDAAASGSPSEGFLAVHAARKAVLESVAGSLPAAQPMRAAERLAVCQVLAAYKGR